MAIVMQHDRLEAVRGRPAEQTGKEHRRVISRKYVTVRKGADVELPVCGGEIHVHASAWLEETAESREELPVVRQVLHHAQQHDRVVLFRRIIRKDALRHDPQPAWRLLARRPIREKTVLLT